MAESPLSGAKKPRLVPAFSLYLAIAVAGAVTVVAVVLAILLIGRSSPPSPLRPSFHSSISSALIDSVKGDRITSNLRLLTKEPHVAGTDANHRVRKTIEDLFHSAGLQNIHTPSYEVLLSYPDWDHPNLLSISDSSGRSLFVSRGISPPIIHKEQSAKHGGHHWLAYSASGTVTGDVVYCHYGREEDFRRLRELGVSVEGRIALIRYGKVFRGDKVKAAQAEGAVAAVIFSDPAEVAQGGLEDVYPRSVWMPGEGVQRGSLLTTKGDPLTPLYPSKAGAFSSRTVEDIKAAGQIPSIPALPISYSTAYQILSRMDGPLVPVEWQGGLNTTYRLGPGMEGGRTVTVQVTGNLTTRKISNVIGFIPGSVEKDRYVILGNHFDAWDYGSIDPNSGTAILAEVARAMVETMKTKQWRPARTIVFAEWDAEEFGLMGSTEWVEEHLEVLRQRAVAYLNMDCLSGNLTLDASTVPSLFDVLVATAKKIPNPIKSEVDKGRKTLYDTWMATFPGHSGLPSMKPPHAGSDQSAFLYYTGIPSVDFNMRNGTGSSYPLYHTLYETPFLNEHLYDTNGFAVHRATGQFWAELARSLSDSPVLPLNASRLADEIRHSYLPLLHSMVSNVSSSPEMAEAMEQLKLVHEAAEDFVHAAEDFVDEFEDVEEEYWKNPGDLRRISEANTRLAGLEQCFVNPRGSHGKPHSRHVLFSISEKNSYASAVFAPIQNAVEAVHSGADKTMAGRAVAMEISIVFHSLNCASNSLKQFI